VCETSLSVEILQLQSKQFGKFAKVSYFSPVEKAVHGFRFRTAILAWARFERD